MKLKVPIKTLCERTGMSRQNYYKGYKVRKRKEADAKLIKQMVKRERRVQSRLGGKKSYEVLKPEMRKEGIYIGRDIFCLLYTSDAADE